MSDVVPAPAGATPSETTQTPAQPAQPSGESAPQTQPAVVDLGLTADQAKAFKTFIDNNGGFDKSFQKLKTAVTARKETQPAQPAAPQVEQPAQPAQPAQAEQTQPQPKPATIPEGFLTPQDIMAQQYNNALMSQDGYAGIKEYIEKGEYLTDMRKMGMTPIDNNGNINDAVIRQFLDLKAKTVPAPQPSTPVTNIPTKTYVEVDGDITTMEQALSISSQGPNHPQYQKALEFARGNIFKQDKK